MDENRNTNQVSVKWCGLLYDDCTWERKDSFLKQTTDAVGTADGIGDDKPSSSAHGTLPSATITPITPAVTDSNDATDSEKNSAAFFFHSRKRDSSSVNHAIAGVLCTELQLYRKRCARPVPLAAPLPIAASPNGGVEFGDFEKLLRGGFSCKSTVHVVSLNQCTNGDHICCGTRTEQTGLETDFVAPFFRASGRAPTRTLEGFCSNVDHQGVSPHSALNGV